MEQEILEWIKAVSTHDKFNRLLGTVAGVLPFIYFFGRRYFDNKQNKREERAIDDLMEIEREDSLKKEIRKNMKKPFIVFLDAGHGGMINGEYVTPGKRSPKFDDGCQLFEGVYNRRVTKLIHDKLNIFSKKEIFVVHVNDLNEDTPLRERSSKANTVWEEYGRPPAIYISIHANGYGDGTKWTSPKGIEVFTSPGQTKSDIFATILLDTMQEELHDSKWRYDESDGDKDKEARFSVLVKTAMPAILSENGFMTNKEECNEMLKFSYAQKIAESHFKAIMKYIKIHT